MAREKSQIDQQFKLLERDLKVAADVDADDLEAAAHAAAELATEEMRTRVPQETGQLKESITFETGEKTRDSVRVIVGFDRHGWYAHFVELGTPHSPADPFLRPAFDENVDELFERMRRTLEARTGG